MAHWATDLACLAVDLLMRSVDAGTESMLFTGFSTWRELAFRFGDGESDLTAQTRTPATSAALAALSWLGANLHRVTPAMQPSFTESQYRWEWHMALVRSLLRCTYHADIPHAKRALAFVAAYDQLTAAAAAIFGLTARADTPGQGRSGVAVRHVSLNSVSKVRASGHGAVRSRPTCGASHPVRIRSMPGSIRYGEKLTMLWSMRTIRNVGRAS